MTTPKIDEELNKASRKYASLEEYPNTVWLRQGFIAGAKFQEERMRAEIEILKNTLEQYRAYCVIIETPESASNGMLTFKEVWLADKVLKELEVNHE